MNSRTRFLEWDSQQLTGAEFNSVTREEGFRLLVQAVKSGEITTIDSVESPLSRQLMAHHRATLFEMNSNWIETTQSWVCPCCSRSKFDVSRLGGKGQILAKLVAHHDHMGEALEESFNRAFMAAGTASAQVHGKRLIEHMAGAFAAHPPVLVCEDCNNADVKASREIGAPRYFSFSIGQIRSFIRCVAHQPHEIVPAQVEAVWESARHAYLLRMELIEKVARAAATDAHWYEPFPYGAVPIPLLGQRPYDHQDVVVRRWMIGDRLLKAFGSTKKVSDPNLSRWRTEPQRNGGRPLPANYVALLCSEEAMQRLWESVPNEWHCPICGRRKVATVEIGERGKLKFHPNSNRFGGSWSKAPLICNRCNSVLMSLKLEVSRRVGYTPRSSYSFVTPDELANVVDARDGKTHCVIPNQAAELVRMVEQRIRDMAIFEEEP